MLQLHAAALQSTSTAYHEFLLKYKPNEAIVYGFVEGKEDPMFYRGLIEQALPQGWEVELIPAGNRDSVLKSHSEFDWNRYPSKRICFFVDRDLTDFLGANSNPIDNLYITDGYSIENEALTFGTYKRILQEVFNITTLTQQDVEKLKQLFDSNIKVFLDALAPVMAEIVSAQRSGLRPTLDDIEVKALFDFVNGRAQIKAAYATADSRAAFAAQCVGLPASPPLSRSSIEAEFLRLPRAESFVRGKYAIWFLVESSSKAHQSIGSIISTYSISPKMKVSIGQKNAMVLLAPRLRCPETLRKFLAATFVSFARPDRTPILQRIAEYMRSLFVRKLV